MNVINKLTRLLFNEKRYKRKYTNNDQHYYKLKANKRLILCINVGRSGTRWLADIFNEHEGVVGTCERAVEYESFYRYVNWYDLDIDLTGVVNVLKDLIVQDWNNHDVSMIVSPYLSHDFISLYNELNPDFVIWGVNDPRFTVTSFYNKGWYEGISNISSEKKILGLMPGKSLSNSFGRVYPVGSFLNRWNKLTRIGKISWFYQQVNYEIYSSIVKIDQDKVFVFKLEEADQNYDYYLNMASIFNLRPMLTKSKFLRIKKHNVRSVDNKKKKWSSIEEKEFQDFTSDFYNNIYKKLS